MKFLPLNKALGFLMFLLLFSAFAKAQTAEVNISQDPKIDQLLALKAKMSKEGDLGDRYKIQLYSGNISQAQAILKRFQNKVGTWSANIKYETPNYKVWIGNFRNRLEADRALLEIKKEFVSAFIFKPER